MKGVSHAAIFVSDIDRSQQWYEDILGLAVTDSLDVPSPLGDGRLIGRFFSFGTQHHDVLLVQQFDLDGNPRPVSNQGLHHLAIELDDDKALEPFVDFLKKRNVQILYGPIRHYEGPGGDGGAGGNYAVYFLDPDGHTIEVCRDMDPFTGAAA